MKDPALLAAALISADTAISSLMRMRVALEELEWERKNAPELHEEARGQGVVRSFVSGELRN